MITKFEITDHRILSSKLLDKMIKLERENNKKMNRIQLSNCLIINTTNPEKWNKYINNQK